MSQVRAQILDVDFPNTAAARIVINAPASKIFEVLANPRAHSSFDGSGTIEKVFLAQFVFIKAPNLEWQ